MKLHTGMSAKAETDAAVQDAVRAALCDADSPAFALVLCTEQYDPERLAAAVNAELGSIPWAGCCAAGVSIGTEFLVRGIVVGVLGGRGQRFGVGLGGPVSQDARGAGRTAVAQAFAPLGALQPDHSRALIVLPDALTGNAAEVVRGAAHEAGAGMVWAGGGAGDNMRFVCTTQFALGAAHSDRVVIIAIDADGPIAAAIRHGWHPYGPTTQVTRAQGATAIELDYESAFDVYRNAATRNGDAVSRKEFAGFAMTHPLGVPQANGEYVIRNPLAVEESGGLRCVAEVPEGSLVRVMQGDRRDLLGAARAAAAAAREGVARALGGAIVFDCVSRYQIHGDHMRDELSAIQAGLGDDVPLLGCLTFGEVGAIDGGAPQFHNKTAVVLALPGES
ncbi:MAG: FIST C-terminal domain-containing protein [Minicystis sp.]